MSYKYLGIAVFVSLVLFFIAIKLYGNSQYDKGELSCKKDVAEAVIEVKEKHEEIRNNRPDNDALIKRLLEGTY